MRACECASERACVRAYACVRVCVRVCVCMCVRVRVCVGAYVRAYVCVCVGGGVLTRPALLAGAEPEVRGGETVV